VFQRNMEVLRSWVRIFDVFWKNFQDFGSNLEEYMDMYFDVYFEDKCFEKMCIWVTYDSLHWKSYNFEIHQIEKPGFLDISQYRFTINFWNNLNVYREIWVSGFVRFRGCSILSGICQMCHVIRWIRRTGTGRRCIGWLQLVGSLKLL